MNFKNLLVLTSILLSVASASVSFNVEPKTLIVQDDDFFFDQDIIYYDIPSEQEFIDLDKLLQGELLEMNSKEFGAFAIGFIEGLVSSVSNKAKECIADTKKTSAEFLRSFAAIRHAFQNKSGPQFRAGLKELGEGLVELPKIYKECGIQTLMEEIKALAERLKAGSPGLIDLFIHESIVIFHNRVELTSLFRMAEAHAANAQHNSFGIDVGKIVGILLQ
ncbi:hypothetical protein CYY_003799 [Polysphondylium violaceum]|uniref:Secreted protein n=1 Tax=Polysphondylium violaceum TaxID=133409 RepID=A0A8J4UZV3_9MYCE|nr:hypothetical protein CYY_003799 [Polysphondylium violaceum]